MKTNKYLIIFLIGMGLLSQNKISAQGEAKGLEIAKAADLSDHGFENSTVSLTMILRNKQGQESTRYMNTSTLELTEDGDKSLIVFDSPRDVKGTATMTYTHKVGSDDQWLYLPSIARVKRISSDNKSGPFMGSEFAYEDLSSQEVEKYTYNFIKEEKVNGVDAYVVERFPTDSKSGYTRQIVWYNKDNYRLEKIDFYDRKNSLLKTLNYSGYQLYLDKFWRADEFLMVNHQSNKQTQLKFNDYKFKTGLTEDDFTQNSLKRAGR